MVSLKGHKEYNYDGNKTEIISIYFMLPTKTLFLLCIMKQTFFLKNEL